MAHVLGRDPRLGEPAVGQQLAQPARVLAIGLRATLATPQRTRLHRLGQMRHRTGADQRVTDEQPPRAGLDRDIDPRPAKRSAQRATAAGVASIRPRITSPVSVSSASKVICARCTSNPATIAIRASFEFRHLPIARMISRRAEGGPSSCHLSASFQSSAPPPGGACVGRRPGAQGRRVLLGKGAVLAHRLAHPLAAESDESEQRPTRWAGNCRLLLSAHAGGRLGPYAAHACVARRTGAQLETAVREQWSLLDSRVGRSASLGPPPACSRSRAIRTRAVPRVQHFRQFHATCGLRASWPVQIKAPPLQDFAGVRESRATV